MSSFLLDRSLGTMFGYDGTCRGVSGHARVNVFYSGHYSVEIF